MELRQLKYFEAVARHSHFTRAALELQVAQPGLSLQVQRLERELGGKVFDRTPHGAQVTELGRLLLPVARRVLAEVDGALVRARELSSGYAGRVSLGSQQSLTAGGLLPEILREFRRARPGVDLTMREDRAEQILSDVREGALDLALLMVPTTGGADDGIRAEHLFLEELVLVAGPDHARVTSSEQVRLGDLAEEPFVAFNEGSGLRDLLERTCQAAGFVPRIGFESDALSSVRAVTAAGLGVAMLPALAARAPGPTVVELTTDVGLSRAISLVTPAERYHSAAAHALAGLLRSRLTSADDAG